MSKKAVVYHCNRLPCVVKEANHQIGSSNPLYDKRRKALPPGKRISRSGKVYYEYRKNRSDLTPEEKPEAKKKKREKKRRSYMEVLHNLKKATEETKYPFKVDKTKTLDEHLSKLPMIGTAKIWREGNYEISEDYHFGKITNYTVKKIEGRNMWDTVYIIPVRESRGRRKKASYYELYYHRFGTVLYESPFVGTAKTLEEAIKKAKKLLDAKFK